MIAIRHNLNLIQNVTSKACFSTSSKCCHYGGTWKNSRRLQNPDMVKSMPTLEFVKEGQLKKTKLVYVCGLGATGSLGLPRFYRPDKRNTSELKPKDVTTSTFHRLAAFSSSDKLVDVACGYGFTILATQVRGTNYSALGFGLNTHSQIGYHSPRPGFPLEIVATPAAIFVPTNSRIVKVACGRSHSILLAENGQVFSLGNNSLGQCGRKINESEIYFGSKTVHKIEVLPRNVSQVVCGQDHSIFLTEDGKVYSCGWGADGQTGLGHYENQEEPAEIKGDINGVKITKVSTYADTVMALDDQGHVFGWGNSEYAQFRTLLGCEAEQFNVPRHLNLKGISGKIVDIAAGGTMCAVLNDRGQVYVWGFGILGKGPKVEQSSRPTLIPETLFGMNPHSPDVKVDKIYASISHFAAITNQGDLFTWGKNRGQLGLAHPNDQYFPMQANMNLALVKKVSLGVDHACAIVEKVC